MDIWMTQTQGHDEGRGEIRTFMDEWVKTQARERERERERERKYLKGGIYI